ncbi:MAG: PD-(D/E)XK nuclease domain-containing protein, partial [Lentisphaeria bacterium]|nr:PD-(D/E)XK nuclease domain-containing protein [Lentisphaeria bacterium]
DGFMKQLQTLFADIPYDMRGKKEHDYQTVIYVIFMMLHIFIEGEHRTGEGRIDLMLSAGEWIYVIELKLNKTAQNAMEQIHDKNYALKFRNRGKRIMLIGANLDSDKGQITDWIKEEYCG